jgi:hypothetical protein
MASPGAGKTSTILATIDALRDRYRIDHRGFQHPLSDRQDR